MANTRRDFVGDSVTTVYDVSFNLGYITKDHVYVYLSSNEYTEQLDYDWLSDTQIELNNPVANGTPFSIRRVVPRDEAINDYENGAILHEANLDASFAQLLMIGEEQEDGYGSASSTWQDDVDANGFRLLNLPVAVEDSEPVRNDTFKSITQTITDIQPTLDGMNQALEDFEEESEAALNTANEQLAAAIVDLGFTPIGNFADGCTVTRINEVVYDGVTDYFYMWLGDLPKVVTAGSNPLDDNLWKVATTGVTKQSGAISLFGKEIGADVNIPATQNAISFDAITAEGVTVTVADTSTWVTFPI